MCDICFCGTQAGYPHAEDCPFPLFRGSDETQARWFAEHKRLRKLAAVRAEINSGTWTGASIRLAELRAEEAALGGKP